MAHVAQPNPAYCAACHCAKNQPHIDFDAAYDGPIQIDDLIICQDCLAAGARLIGLVPAGQAEQDAAEYRDQNAKLRARLAELQKYADSVVKALQLKPQRQRQGATTNHHG